MVRLADKGIMQFATRLPVGVDPFRSKRGKSKPVAGRVPGRLGRASGQQAQQQSEGYAQLTQFRRHCHEHSLDGGRRQPVVPDLMIVVRYPSFIQRVVGP